jgi:S-adenosylmethionine:tRNA ribosyltransferase-isomerase
MRTDEFDYDLPDELIAQHPVEPRDRARLMIVDRESGTWEHHIFAELPDLLHNGDVLVRNNTRVLPARLVGRRCATGGRWEGLYLRSRWDGTWEILASTRGQPRAGEAIDIGRDVRLILLERESEGRWIVRPDPDEPARAILERVGLVPLPPYIRKGREAPGDRVRYQTVFARTPGSVAAPTAGLHFTPGLLERLAGRGIDCLDVTLHVGIGTFRPIAAERIEDHRLHAEWAELSEPVAGRLNAARAAGRRIVAVGTTSARTLETAARAGSFRPFAEETDLYLMPGHAFRGLDGLITNFHLPRSSLLVLVSALAGTELIRAAYLEAVKERYRFYSYGDAMLIL